MFPTAKRLVDGPWVRQLQACHGDVVVPVSKGPDEKGHHAHGHVVEVEDLPRLQFVKFNEMNF